MKYISEKGTVKCIMEANLLRRTLSFTMNNPRTFSAEKMAKIVATEGQGYVKFLTFQSRFKHPDGSMHHSYDVIFEIPHCEITNSRMNVNRIMVLIENRLEKEANVSYGRDGQGGRHKREWMDEEWIQGRIRSIG